MGEGEYQRFSRDGRAGNPEKKFSTSGKFSDIHSDLDILLRHIRSAAAGLYALVLHGTEQNQEDQADLALLVHDLAREARRRAERLYHGGDLWRQRVEGEEPQSEESSPQ